MEDRLLAPVGRDHLGVGVEPHAEPALAPASDRLAQLRKPLGERITGDGLDASGERRADQRVGFLTRVPLAEVDQRDAGGGEPPLRLLEPDERVGAGGGERGGELHG